MYLISSKLFWLNLLQIIIGFFVLSLFCAICLESNQGFLCSKHSLSFKSIPWWRTGGILALVMVGLLFQVWLLPSMNGRIDFFLFLQISLERSIRLGGSPINLQIKMMRSLTSVRMTSRSLVAWKFLLSGFYYYSRTYTTPSLVWWTLSIIFPEYLFLFILVSLIC